jgi:capsular exopolysaccharide synthesis family protein
MAQPKLAISEYFNQESPLATEYRRLFQNLRRLSVESELKSILVTSAVTGEGKSMVSSLLAITAARKGYKTLLIDCDLRRPTIHRLFRLDRTHGLAEVLSDGVPFKSIIKKTSMEHLDLVTAGKSIAHPSELFNTQALDTLISELKFYYDYTIIDSPPVIPVSDPMILSQYSDGVIVVVKAGSTAREISRRAVDILTANKASLVGVVLNNSSNSLPYYYDYSHYHYDYSSTPKDSDGSLGATGANRANRETKSNLGADGLNPRRENRSSKE